MLRIRTEHFYFIYRHYGSHKTIMGLRLAAGADKPENFGILSRHRFIPSALVTPDPSLLNETVRHDGQKLAGFDAKKF